VCIYALCEIIPSLKPSSNLVVYQLSIIFLFIIFLTIFTLDSFFFFGGFFQGGGLGTVFVLFGIFHYGRGVHREVTRLLRELVSTAQVDLLHLSIIEEGDGARPDERADNSHGV